MGNFELSLLKKYSSFGKRGLELPGILPPYNSTTMVEMKMRQQQVSDITRFHTKLLQTIDKPAVAMVENLALNFAQAVTYPGIDHNRFAAFENQRADKIKADAVSIVRRMLALPQFAWDYPEHAPAVVTPDAITEESDGKLADLYLW